MTRITNSNPHPHPHIEAAPSSSSSAGSFGSIERGSGKPIKYRIAIKQPEQWKIQSVARYKKHQQVKFQRKQEAEQLLLDRQLQQQQRHKDDKPSEDKKKNSKKVTSSHNQHEHDAQQLKQQQQEIDVKYEANVRELANCHFAASVLKARIAALHSVKVSLLWLLKKASLHERANINDHLVPLNSNN